MTALEKLQAWSQEVNIPLETLKQKYDEMLEIVKQKYPNKQDLWEDRALRRVHNWIKRTLSLEEMEVTLLAVSPLVDLGEILQRGVSIPLRNAVGVTKDLSQEVFFTIRGDPAREVYRVPHLYKLRAVRGRRGYTVQEDSTIEDLGLQNIDILSLVDQGCLRKYKWKLSQLEEAYLSMQNEPVKFIIVEADVLAIPEVPSRTGRRWIRVDDLSGFSGEGNGGYTVFLANDTIDFELDDTLLIFGEVRGQGVINEWAHYLI